MTKMRPSDTDLPEHIVDAIRRTWPEGIVDMPANMDDASFEDIYPRLKASFSSISRCSVVYEREPQGGPQWTEGSDPEVEAPDWNEESRSYHMFFISPMDERFQFETDTLEPDEEGIERRFQGEGRIGCAVGISIVAPFAVVTLDQMEVFESGARSEPDVEPHIFGLDGRKLDLEDYYRELLDEAELSILRNLQAEIVRVLEDCDIAVIPEEDLDRPVPWLRAGEEVLVAHASEPFTVRQAFFFHGL